MKAMHAHTEDHLPATVAFPFGFPSPGAYRIFLQFERERRIETASFDARVE